MTSTIPFLLSYYPEYPFSTYFTSDVAGSLDPHWHLRIDMIPKVSLALTFSSVLAFSHQMRRCWRLEGSSLSWPWLSPRLQARAHIWQVQVALLSCRGIPFLICISLVLNLAPCQFLARCFQTGSCKPPRPIRYNFLPDVGSSTTPVAFSGHVTNARHEGTRPYINQATTDCTEDLD